MFSFVFVVQFGAFQITGRQIHKKYGLECYYIILWSFGNSAVFEYLMIQMSAAAVSIP